MHKPLQAGKKNTVRPALHTLHSRTAVSQTHNLVAIGLPYDHYQATAQVTAYTADLHTTSRRLEQTICCILFAFSHVRV